MRRWLIIHTDFVFYRRRTMKDVREAFNEYWEDNFGKLVVPINHKNEMKKVAFHAYKEAYSKAQVLEEEIAELKAGQCSGSLA